MKRKTSKVPSFGSTRSLKEKTALPPQSPSNLWFYRCSGWIPLQIFSIEASVHGFIVALGARRLHACLINRCRSRLTNTAGQWQNKRRDTASPFCPEPGPAWPLGPDPFPVENVPIHGFWRVQPLQCPAKRSHSAQRSRLPPRLKKPRWQPSSIDRRPDQGPKVNSPPTPWPDAMIRCSPGENPNPDEFWLSPGKPTRNHFTPL